MQPDLILQEDGFCLEFRSINKLSLLDEFPQLAEGMVGDAGYVLQEMIILPPYMVGQANNYSAKTVAPLQNEPTDYGKLFSRAVAVGFPQSKLLLISGTAAIDKAGSSVYIGNFKSQMAFTLEIVSAILSQGRKRAAFPMWLRQSFTSREVKIGSPVCVYSMGLDFLAPERFSN